MFHTIMSILKVLFRHGDEIIELIQEIITEVKGKTEIEADLKDLEARTMPESEV